MDIFGISLPSLKKNIFLASIKESKGQIIVFTPNPEMLLKMRKDKEFREILSQADFLISDGIGLYIAYQILDSKLPFFLNILALPYYFFNLFFRRKKLYQKYGERICGSDMTRYLLKEAQKEGKKVAVVDLYSPDDEKKLAIQAGFIQKIQKLYPKISLQLFIWNPQDKKNIMKNIQNYSPDFLFSTLGMKQQEENILEIMKTCP